MRPAGKMTIERYNTDWRALGAAQVRHESRYCFSTRVCFANPLFVEKLKKQDIGQHIVGQCDEGKAPEQTLTLYCNRRLGTTSDDPNFKKPGIQHPQASWRYMFATQPPLPVLRLGSSIGSTTIEVRSGLDFFSHLGDRLLEQAQSIAAVQDIQTLEAGSSTSSEVDGDEFVLNFSKHPVESPQGVDALWVGRGEILMSRPSDNLKLAVRFN